MAAAFIFWIIPEKPLGLGIVILGIGIGGYLVIAKLPRKDMKDLQ